MKKFTISTVPLKEFDGATLCAGAYCTFNGKFLLLRRHPKKLFGNEWGVPGGKIDPSETIHEGLVREIFEEVGVQVDPQKLKELTVLYIESESRDHQVIYHMFYCPLEGYPELDLHLDEHLEAKWVTFEEAERLPLVSAGGKEALHIFKAIATQPMFFDKPI